MTIKLTSEDRWDITDTLARYCIALDDRDFDELVAIFTPDVSWAYDLGASGTGRDALVEMLRTTLAMVPVTHHAMSATQLVAPGSESVSVRSYLTGQHVRQDAPAGQLYMMAGWYVDDFVQTPDGWRSASRQFKSVWSSGNPTVFQRQRAGRS
jgi:3-phenylpropionate/cinnamic acid dioxygenase small subunit